jgi:hypothetical protein
MNERRKIGGITKESFLALVEQQGGNVELEGIKFDMRQCLVGKLEQVTEYQKMLGERCDCRITEVDDRLAEQDEHIRKSRKINLAASGAAGLVGGFVAMLAKLRFW